MKRWSLVSNVTEIIPMIQDDPICTAFHYKVIRDIDLSFVDIFV